MTEDLSFQLWYLWYSVSGSLALRVFAISALIMLFGVCMQVLKVVQQAHKANAVAGNIPARKAYRPSKRDLMLTFFALIAMTMTGVQALIGKPPFTGPYDAMYIIAVFLIGGSMGILAELKWENGKEYPFAFLVGTAMALMLLSVRYNVGVGSLATPIGYGIILLLCLYLAKRIFFPVWSRWPRIISVASFVGWTALYVFA
jgi:hypothetical protein